MPPTPLFATALLWSTIAMNPELPSLIPRPSEVDPRGGEFELTSETVILVEHGRQPLIDRVMPVLDVLRRGTGLPLPIRAASGPAAGAVFVGLLEGGNSEAYMLEVSPESVVLLGGDLAGVGWGMQTLRQLLPAAVESPLPAVAVDPGRPDGQLRPLPSDCRYAARNVAPTPTPGPEPLSATAPTAWTIPCIHVTDRPAFGWRGVLLDCCRHYMDVDAIERLLDLMALHKLNRLHWHLTEDQAWRLEIRSHPELTAVGAWRCDQDGNRYGGYYTQDDARHVVAYAQARGITVVPEIELPGHSQAALAARPDLGCRGDSLDVQTCWGVWPDVYCAGNDAVFTFLEDVLGEVLEIFPSPYIHIGGDECPKDRWRECPLCQQRIADEGLDDEHELQSWFVRRIERWLAARDRCLVGWDEILEGGLAPGATVQSWQGLDGAVVAARKGHDTIVSPTSHCYLDADIGVTDLATAHGFGLVPEELSTDEARHVLGGEMNLWTEYAPQATMDERLFPRLCGLSEAFWSRRGGDDTELSAFWQRYRGHRVRLDRLGVKRAYEGRPVRLTATMDGGRAGWSLRWEVEGTVPGGDLGAILSFGGAAERVGATGTTFTSLAGPVAVQLTIDNEPYGAPWELQLERHLALGAPFECDPWPGRKYRPEGNHPTLDGVLPDVDYHDQRWLAWEGPDATVTVDLRRPQPVSVVEAMCLHAGGRLIYSPERVHVSVSTDGEQWHDLGDATWRLEPGVFARTLRTYRINAAAPITARWVRLSLEQRRDVPAWPWAPLSPPWMFLGQIVVR